MEIGQDGSGESDRFEMEDTVELDDSDDLISSDMIIAVVADDPNAEYYLLKVTKPAYTVRKPTSDAWGASYPKGTSVICGLYYDRKSESQLSYTLIKRKQAIVPANSVLYICSQLTAEVNITLNENIHLDILERLHEVKLRVL
ncbi:MAG: hypothetical protein ABW185_21635 [Sedimenticola sp.]